MKRMLWVWTVVCVLVGLLPVGVQGADLQLKTLSLEGGQVAVDGTVSALIYEEPRQSGWRRFFG